MSTINTGSISVSDSDADWFRVMCAIDSNSTRAGVTLAVTTFVRENKGQYIEQIQYTARKYGLTPSEAFNRLSRGEDLGDPLPRFEVDPLMEDQSSDELMD